MRACTSSALSSSLWRLFAKGHNQPFSSSISSVIQVTRESYSLQGSFAGSKDCKEPAPYKPELLWQRFKLTLDISQLPQAYPHDYGIELLWQDLWSNRMTGIESIGIFFISICESLKKKHEPHEFSNKKRISRATIEYCLPQSEMRFMKVKLKKNV